MTSVTKATESALSLPDHTQLPELNGTFVKNWQEHLQSTLLTDSITPVLKERHPDSHFLTGEERAEVERQKREKIVEKLRLLSPEQLNALDIDPNLLD